MKTDWKSCIRIGITLFLLYLAIHYWGNVSGVLKLILNASASLIIGCITAYILNILMSFYEKHYFMNSSSSVVIKSRRIVCMLASIISLFGIIVLIVYLVVPELISCFKFLADEVPRAVEKLVVFINNNEFISDEIGDSISKALSGIDWPNKVKQFAGLLIEGVGGTVQVAVTAISVVVSNAVKLVIGLIFAIYILMGKERIGRQFSLLADKYLKESHNRKIRYFLGVINGCFHKFIVGQCTEAVILGLLCMVGMTLLRMPYAVMIGVLIGFTALIPVAGAYIGAGIGAFMILTVSPWQVIPFLIFIVVLQQLEGNIIYPRVVGTSIGLPGVWVLAAVTVGGGVFGIPGMLIGVPLTASVYKLLRNDVYRMKEI